MILRVLDVLQKESYFYYIHEGIHIVNVINQHKGTSIAKTILYSLLDRKTIFFLSGGNTPKNLYTLLAEEEIILPGAVCMIDERYGEKLHFNSNEYMIQNTGLLRYFNIRNIPFYPMLYDKLPIDDVAMQYDSTLRFLFNIYPKSVAIMGIGRDGHTAGIAPNRENFMNPIFDNDRKNDFVGFYDDKNGPFKSRITLTFLGLSMIDLFIILVFGKEKKFALESLFKEGFEEELPARFYKRPEIAKRTVIITDQKIL